VVMMSFCRLGDIELPKNNFYRGGPFFSFPSSEGRSSEEDGGRFSPKGESFFVCPREETSPDFTGHTRSEVPFPPLSSDRLLVQELAPKKIILESRSPQFFPLLRLPGILLCRTCRLPQALSSRRHGGSHLRKRTFLREKGWLSTS